MSSHSRSPITNRILEKSMEIGASLAGIASVSALRDSPYYVDGEDMTWPGEVRSVLVLALAHRPSEPQLDWWGDIPGKTRGNRKLMGQAERMAQWLDEELEIDAHPLPYRIIRGSIPLKDAAVLAGLGAFGKNNMLLTPELGPHVRLRGLFLATELEPTGPLDWNPCAGCDMPCRQACPQLAFRSGSYSRDLCHRQMYKDVENAEVVDDWAVDGTPSQVVKFCRACELACPVPK